MKALKNKCFTLLELLIVIAVIAILASLLLPALSRVREKGMEISCLSNLRMSGIAMNSYAMEQNMFYPSYVTYIGKRYYSWAEWMYQLKYLPYESPVVACTLPNTQALKVQLSGVDFHAGVYGIYYVSTDAINNVIVNWTSGWNKFYGINIKRIKGTSYFPVLADSAKNETEQEQFYTLTLQGSAYKPAMRHQNKCNVLFADGHASSNTPRQYYDNLVNSEINMTSSTAGNISYFDKNGIGQTFSEFIE
jgi:prepilin-type processing-associated H-X9-DG protein/prepilin-type N-terminal cleavage/methylation domain-containing protein